MLSSTTLVIQEAEDIFIFWRSYSCPTGTFNKMQEQLLSHPATQQHKVEGISIHENLAESGPACLCVSLFPDIACVCVCVSVRLSFNNWAGFVSISFWFLLFVAKRDNKPRLLIVFELNVVGKVTNC